MDSTLPDRPPPSRWLSVVGIGEDGWDGLSPAARAVIERAACVYGGARHLAFLPVVPGQERVVWPSPLPDALPGLLARRGQPVCVVASGDPLWYGVGATLARVVPAHEMMVLPAPSAYSLACARLGWPVQDTRCLTLHGRPLELVIPHLQQNAQLLILSWDGTTPAKLAALLRARGFGASRLTAMEAMGGPREAQRSASADTWDQEAEALGPVADLNTLAVDCVAGPDARIHPLAPGLPDAWFDHDGQITKREVRAVTLSLLAPLRGETLWDVGAGSGSIGIEWMLTDPANRAIAVESHPDRQTRILANATALGVPGLELVRGRAPAALDGLSAPDAVFIGGGVSNDGVLDSCWSALKPGGRLVANAVTLEGEAVLYDAQRRLGGELTQISVSRAVPVGGFRGWKPFMPVTLWRADKP